MNCTRMLFLSPCSSSFPCSYGVCGILSQFFIRLTLPVFVKQLIYLFNYTYFTTTCISATVTLSHSTKLGLGWRFSLLYTAFSTKRLVIHNFVFMLFHEFKINTLIQSTPRNTSTIIIYKELFIQNQILTFTSLYIFKTIMLKKLTLLF